MKNRGSGQHPFVSNVSKLALVLFGVILVAIQFAPNVLSDKQHFEFELGCDADLATPPTIRVLYKTSSDSFFRLAETGEEIPGLVGIPAIQPRYAGVRFDGFVRYPAERGEQSFRRMENVDGIPTSYYRDAFVGGQVTITGAVNGDKIGATITLPSSSGNNTAVFADRTFFSSIDDGRTNCFVSADPNLVPFCGSNSLTLIWYIPYSQCYVGTFSGTFTANGSPFHSGQFNQLPQIAPEKVPLYNQGAYSDAYDSICKIARDLHPERKNFYLCDDREGEEVWTIAGKGCSITSAAMVLNYHGIPADPSTLNTWLKENKGYDAAGDLFWSAVERYARTTTGRNDALTYVGPSENLENAICTYGPTITGVLNVQGYRHWVAATGRDQKRTTYLINDPDGGLESSLMARYNNKFDTIRRYSGPEYSFTDSNGLTFRFHSPGEMLITDPLGRRLGFDPSTGRTFNEIPNSGYSILGIGDATDTNPVPLDYDPPKELELVRIPEGEYTLRITGTGNGTYKLLMYSMDVEGMPSGEIFENIPITLGEVHIYTIEHSKALGSEIHVTGPTSH